MAAEASTQAARRSQSQTRRRSAPRSGVWVHFTRFTDDNGEDKAQCKRCSLVLGASTRNGTSTLRAHVRICWGDQAVPASNSRAPQQLPVPLPPPCAPSSSRGREPGGGLQDQDGSGDLARMIALHGYDPSFVEDDYFRSFVRRLNPEFELPSRIAIEEMCDGICDEARRDLLGRLRRAPGKVNVAVGRAETMEEQVVYLACHFIDDGWNLHKPVLHAIVTTGHHDDDDGPILGLDISTNGIDYVDDIGFFIRGHHDIINHRLFMVAYDTRVKDIQPALKDNDDDAVWFCINSRVQLLSTTYVDKVLHSIARCFLPHEDFTEAVLEDSDEMALLLTRQERLELFAELNLHYGWAYDEHWYACYCNFEVLCRKGFSSGLTDADLVIIKLLCKLWQKIYCAIQKVSSSTSPTANLCLAELFKLRKILQLELTLFSSEDHGGAYYGPFFDFKDVTCVLREASYTLDKAVQDSYLSWSLPLALDPRYKLKFITFCFEGAYGSEAAKEYISKVMTMITELYADYATEYGTTTDGADHSGSASAMDITNSGDDPWEKAWNEHCRSEQGMTTQVTRSSYPEAETELDRYLRDRRVHPQAEGFDILSWWKAHSSKYPMVARMARDALAMPICSKLSSDQIAQVRSILRGYSKKPYRAKPEEFIAPLSI